VRELVHDLRPPVLDQLGLLAAIREHGLSLNGDRGLHVEVVASPSPAALSALPAAVEVAAYRITLEAMANVARHAAARHCRVILSVDESLRIEIVDDGRGLPAEIPAGVGIRSMQERAAELGGTVAVESKPEQGTRVSAVIPVVRP
jgi:two-component system NarL family sensor kinase